jgi:hypothetical protein
MGDLDDWEAGVVRDPHTPPQALADIAERRYDLHPAIAAHPRVYPGLIQWMESVKPDAAPPAPLTPPVTAQSTPYANAGPSAQYYPISAGRPVPPPRRRGVGCWIAGCGCLTLAGLFLVVLFVLGGLGSLTSSGDGDGTPSAQSGSDEISENIATYQAELETIRTLSADFEGNPVAPLILDQPRLDEIAARAADPDMNVFESRGIVQDIGWVRANLEPIVAAAQQRRANASGSVSEALVDQAGNGYIDIAWDAAEHCGDVSEPDKVTVACPTGGSAPAIHIMAESYYPSQDAFEHVVLHELAHLYQSADQARFADGAGDVDRLLAQGLFNGSEESFADCYALTYQNLWTLDFGDIIYGYGYICNDSERQQIRDWAAALNVPMPG